MKDDKILIPIIGEIKDGKITYYKQPNKATKKTTKKLSTAK